VGVTNTQTDGARQRAAVTSATLLGVMGMILLTAWLMRGPVLAIVYSAAITEFDANVRSFMRSGATHAVDTIFVIVSYMGSPVAMSVLAVAGVGWLMAGRGTWRRSPAVLAVWIMAFAGSSVLALSLKRIFGRQRPAGAAEFLHAMSYSFPSTHTLTSLVGFGMLAAVALVNVPPGRAVADLHRNAPTTSRRNAVIVACAVAVIVAVAASRVVLGVHFASDVVAGAVVGSLWLSVCVAALRWEMRQQYRA
jgi:membrane-associated phospholipid phosphatase